MKSPYRKIKCKILPIIVYRTIYLTNICMLCKNDCLTLFEPHSCDAIILPPRPIGPTTSIWHIKDIFNPPPSTWKCPVLSYICIWPYIWWTSPINNYIRLNLTLINAEKIESLLFFKIKEKHHAHDLISCNHSQETDNMSTNFPWCWLVSQPFFSAYFYNLLFNSIETESHFCLGLLFTFDINDFCDDVVSYTYIYVESYTQLLSPQDTKFEIRWAIIQFIICKLQ